ncbi:hypothetical protein NFO65_08445 [Neorhizobium galegae]|uniref:hypothetical protein n=1 Tax=Neorhizobium galegae TaxID=399 RepID=UPI002101D39C|nr:hypothetical protein [Neorhizobium galegae]MCQ1570766.1 hypothetical protein [Neorhizobium galegae]
MRVDEPISEKYPRMAIVLNMWWLSSMSDKASVLFLILAPVLAVVDPLYLSAGPISKIYFVFLPFALLGMFVVLGAVLYIIYKQTKRKMGQTNSD